MCQVPAAYGAQRSAAGGEGVMRIAAVSVAAADPVLVARRPRQLQRAGGGMAGAGSGDNSKHDSTEGEQRWAYQLHGPPLPNQLVN